MYRKPDDQMSIEDFILPFGGKLDKDNRWIKMAGIIPWHEIEEKLPRQFFKHVKQNSWKSSKSFTNSKNTCTTIKLTK